MTVTNAANSFEVSEGDWGVYNVDTRSSDATTSEDEGGGKESKFLMESPVKTSLMMRL